MRELILHVYFFLIHKNLVVTGNTDMSVIGNEYTSDGRGDDARRC
jgi:hypothetical protein